MIRTYAKKTPDPSDVELQNARLARKIAAESIVLLENDGTLPLKGKKIALFGEGAVFTVKGGTGSGEVNCRHTVSIWEGLKNAGFSITTEPWLKAYSEFVKKAKADYTAMMRKRAGFMNFAQIGYIVSHPFNAPNGAPLSEKDMLQDAEACIYVLSRQAGENVDRRPVEGDFLLTKTEIENIRKCVERYPHVILVINIGGIVDLTPIEDLALSSILFFAQQGQEGGNSLADILTGKTTPSGKLAYRRSLPATGMGTWPDVESETYPA